MNFCSQCGARVVRRIPADDDRPRFVCQSCGTIHYQNPIMVVGCIPEWKDDILLCRRAIEPRWGKWTLPAGYLEKGETAAEGARREAMEEAGAAMGELVPFCLFNITHVSQIYLMFRSPLLDSNFEPGKESQGGSCIPTQKNAGARRPRKKGECTACQDRNLSARMGEAR